MISNKNHDNCTIELNDVMEKPQTSDLISNSFTIKWRFYEPHCINWLGLKKIRLPLIRVGVSSTPVYRGLMAPSAWLEHAALCSASKCSNPLSYEGEHPIRRNNFTTFPGLIKSRTNAQMQPTSLRWQMCIASSYLLRITRPLASRALFSSRATW